jgi:hypothetical protein
LARINADKPDEPLRKYLWLRIAKHIICELKDTKHAVQFLNQSDVLKIEDILCYFPDFTVIDDLKVTIKNTKKGILN